MAHGDGCFVGCLKMRFHLPDSHADLNIFTSTFAAVLVISFLQLKTPTGTVREKLGRMDWM
jgi:hypothetical protein